MSAVLAGYAVIPRVCDIGFPHLGYGEGLHSVCGFKFHGPVCVQKISVHILFEIGEHRTVSHIVTVDNEVGALKVAPPVKERYAALTVLPVKAAAEIFLRFFRRVHDGVTDICSVNREPADAVGVFRNERLYIAFYRRLFRRL